MAVDRLDDDVPETGTGKDVCVHCDIDGCQTCRSETTCNECKEGFTA